MPNTTRGYTYPDSSGSDRIWEHFQELATDIDTDVGNLNTLRSVPVGRARQATLQSGIVDVTTFAITLDAEDYDSHTQHDTSSNNSRITPNLAGYYQFTGNVCFAGQSDYVGLDALFRLNGSTSIPGTNRVGAPGSNTTISLPISVTWPMNGGSDYMELCGRADRTGNATSGTSVSAFLASALEWRWVRPL